MRKFQTKGEGEMADALVASGMAGAGYQYIVLDDFWVGGRNAKNE